MNTGALLMVLKGLDCTEGGTLTLDRNAKETSTVEFDDWTITL